MTGPQKRKDGVLGVSKLLQINLTFSDVRLVIGVSIDIFFVFLFLMFLFMFFLYVIFHNIVTGLNVSEFNQMYETLG